MAGDGMVKGTRDRTWIGLQGGNNKFFLPVNKSVFGNNDTAFLVITIRNCLFKKRVIFLVASQL